MGKIVYHGTFSEKAPHEYDQPTFHAGTLDATDQRLEDEMGHGSYIAEGGVPIWRVHKYEIGEKAPMSRGDWGDPMWPRDKNAVPEHKENRIYPYTNVREDRGSTSFVIPTGFVGGHVKHLGTQFQGVVGMEGEAALDTAYGMLGVPKEKRKY